MQFDPAADPILLGPAINKNIAQVLHRIVRLGDRPLQVFKFNITVD